MTTMLKERVRGSYSELQIIDRCFDQPGKDTAFAKIFICSSQRSGSWMLSRYMMNAGLGLPAEYFHPHHIPSLARRFGVDGAESLQWDRNDRVRRWAATRFGRDRRAEFIGRYIDKLVSCRTVDGVFAAKIHYSHYTHSLANQHGWRMLDGGVLVHLYRHDLLDQAVSWHFSELTGRWDFSDEQQTTPLENPNFFDFDRIHSKIRQLAEQDAGWRIFFAQNGLRPLSISYEELARDCSGMIARIGERAGISPSSLDLSYSEARPSSKADSGLPSKHEIKQEFIRHCSRRVIPESSLS